MAPQPELLTTPLTIWHREHGARMVPFAGYEMPVQYRGVLAEHAVVREKVGLFDVTHMGEIELSGAGTAAWLDRMVTNRVAKIAPGKVVYNAMCREDGGVLDDMLVYRLAEERYLVVCNAANHAKIVTWLTDHLPASGVALNDRSAELSLVAVQGPAARDLVGRLGALADQQEALAELEFYAALICTVAGDEWLVSRTGYTGEHGYELYVPNAAAESLWSELLGAGEDLGVEPVGLAARDTLRFELGYCLYGHELSEEITPLEAGIGWAVKLKKESFVGREALVAQKAAGAPRRSIGLAISGRAIARQGAVVRQGGQVVGVVTSGTFSPSLRRSLAIALVAAEATGEDFEVEIRGRQFEGLRTPVPFLPSRVKGDPRAERTLS